jgi:membrane fusion protein (multidrug efflux system)
MIYRLLLAAGAAIGVAAGGSWLWRGSDAKQPASAQSAQPSASSAAASSAAAIEVEVEPIRPEPLEVQVTATGTLLGRESVEIVSELSRRLVAVRAEEGLQVARGDVLFELDRTDLEAELAKLEVQAQLARVTLDRTERLNAEGLSNRQELDLARARVDEANADRQALRVTLSKTLIRAPFAGTLGLRRVSAGAWVSPNTLLCTLQDTSSLKLDFTLPERYASAVARGTRFHFRVEGRPETFDASVAAIEPAVDRVTRSLLVRGRVDATTGLLPGSAASVEMPLRVEQALLVPAISVIPGVDGRRVFLADQGRARSVPVELGFRSADRVQVVGGLSTGDQVITTNLLRLRDDLPITVRSGVEPR